MLKVIADKINFLKSLENEIDRAVIRIIDRNKSVIVAMNLEQLEEGMNGLGVDISSYAPYSDRYKKWKGQSRVDLLNEGDFYKGFVVEVNGDEFKLTSNDIKDEWLVLHYGKDIYGLTDENMSKLKDIIKKDITDEIRNN